jgi:hypothetical protein
MRRQLLEHIGDLEALGNADARELVLRQTGDVLSEVADAALGRREGAADNIEESAFSRAVRTDDGGQLTWLERDADIIQCLEFAEALRHAADFEYRLAHFAAAPLNRLRCSQAINEPQTPRGKNSTKMMKITPTTAIQCLVSVVTTSSR